MLKDLLIKNRSYRRFEEDYPVSSDDLKDMIDAVRLSASARNSQPLKFILITEKEIRDEIFPCLGWAGYLKEWDGPEAGERPAAYIIQLHDVRIASWVFCDDGIAAQSILLTAVEKGLGGCIIASVKKDELAEKLNIPEHFKINHVIALGKPAEKVVIEEISEGNVKYWRDENGIHHVPKRPVSELIWKNGEEA